LKEKKHRATYKHKLYTQGLIAQKKPARVHSRVLKVDSQEGREAGLELCMLGQKEKLCKRKNTEINEEYGLSVDLGCFLYFLLLLFWGYTVTFTEVLTIYHT
jgi:hypothetical protein